MGTLDAVLEPFLRKEPPGPGPQRSSHRRRRSAAAGNARAMRRSPPPSTLAKRRGLTPFAGLVNAVLRKGRRRRPVRAGRSRRPRAWIRRPGSGPAWGQSARAIATAHQTEAPLDVTLKPGIAPPEGGAAAAHRIGPLPSRHARRRHSRLRIGRPLGAGRRRRAAGAPPRRLGQASVSPTCAPPLAARPRNSPPPAPLSPRSSATPPASNG